MNLSMDLQSIPFSKDRTTSIALILHKLCIDRYNYKSSAGFDHIYTREEIEKAKRSPSFEREYNLKYLGKVGNVFHTQDIEAAICTQQEGQEMMDAARILKIWNRVA